MPTTLTYPGCTACCGGGGGGDIIGGMASCCPPPGQPLPRHLNCLMRTPRIGLPGYNADYEVAWHEMPASALTQFRPPYTNIFNPGGFRYTTADTCSILEGVLIDLDWDTSKAYFSRGNQPRCVTNTETPPRFIDRVSGPLRHRLFSGIVDGRTLALDLRVYLYPCCPVGTGPTPCWELHFDFEVWHLFGPGPCDMTHPHGWSSLIANYSQGQSAVYSNWQWTGCGGSTYDDPCAITRPINFPMIDANRDAAGNAFCHCAPPVAPPEGCYIPNISSPDGAPVYQKPYISYRVNAGPLNAFGASVLNTICPSVLFDLWPGFDSYPDPKKAGQSLAFEMRVYE